MIKETSRRDFLGLSTLGVVAALASPLRPISWVEPVLEAPKTGSEISIWVTSDEERFAVAPRSTWQPVAETSGGDEIRLDPSLTFQEILGFGGSFTDAACSTFHQLAPAAREHLLHELFHPSEMGLSVGRICVGASDYATKLYSFDEGEPDPELKRFSISHDREYILPVLRQARQANPDLFVFSSPWSPPGWMKFNGSMLGGSMRRHYLPVYAQYYLKFLQAYAAEGVPVAALTPQNEVDTDQDGRMPACIWPQEYEIEFVRDHLGPLLAENGMPVKIWILDHNYDLWGRAVGTLEDKKLRQYASGVAWHGYRGSADMMSKVHELYPDVEMHWTEGGPDYTDPSYGTDWCKWGGTFSAILRNWCRSITAWNLALDQHGRPNIGPFPCGGVVTVDSETKEITRSGQYWALAHYSRVIRRGARRFDSQSGAVDLEHVALGNPDGQQVLVVTNRPEARSLRLKLGEMTASVRLKANSLTTLAWGG
ncbi:MAG TPA: glycoside hydrolase family 30 beta sandwich domain-containing protein [Terriglobales bacterium]|nr:glycoside hydrolase family 30 beta sandwich domain-containing protein [Terriglobales bacterium]